MAAASKAELRQWHQLGQHMNTTPTHMVVVVDTFDWEDYPVYTSDPKTTVEQYNGKDMQKVMEVYDLRKPFVENGLAWDF